MTGLPSAVQLVSLSVGMMLPSPHLGTEPAPAPALTARDKPDHTSAAASLTAPPSTPLPPPQEVSIHKTVIPPRTLSPPLPPTLCRAPGPPCPPASLPGHPREGQSASLLGGKFILLDELEGSSLHRCLDINSQEELVCKVSYLLQYPQYLQCNIHNPRKVP